MPVCGHPVGIEILRLAKSTTTTQHPKPVIVIHHLLLVVLRHFGPTLYLVSL